MSLSDIMGHAGMSGYAVAGLILFLIAFVAVAVRTFWPGRRRQMDEAARLPLDDDLPGTHRSGANE
jgi:cbb3-type cytochrome oxidase subunit 3